MASNISVLTIRAEVNRLSFKPAGQVMLLHVSSWGATQFIWGGSFLDRGDNFNIQREVGRFRRCNDGATTVEQRRI